MNPNQQPPPMYTTRHYVHDPRGNPGNFNEPPQSGARPYPYYSNNQPPTSVTYINDRPGPGPQYPPPPRPPPNANFYPQQQQQHQPPPQPNHPQRGPRPGPPAAAGGGGGIEKTNMMSNESPFHDPARRYEQSNSGHRQASITAPPKGDGGTNKTLNLSEESPFHNVYGGYHYPSQIDPTKRITTQGSAARSTDNKSLNLSDESPFYSTYGRYHYPSQIDPQKRITEMPKGGGPLSATNEMSNENPFSNYRPPSPRNYGAGPGPNAYGPPPPGNPNWDRNNYDQQGPSSYRPQPGQGPPPNFYNQQQPPPASMRPPSPPAQQPPARPQPQRANPSAPQDKTSLNMSPDNPFASTYGQYHYPSAEEIKAQKRAGERANRFGDQPPPGNNRAGPPPPGNQMTEYPEAEKKDVIAGKGNTKFSSFEVNF